MKPWLAMLVGLVLGWAIARLEIYWRSGRWDYERRVQWRLRLLTKERREAEERKGAPSA